jgi:hypothetical protein
VPFSIDKVSLVNVLVRILELAFAMREVVLEISLVLETAFEGYDG